MIRKVSLATARAMAIHSQWLNRQHVLTSKADALQVIEQLGYVQIDTLSVVERAHHHILWNRMPSYNVAWLNELLQERQLFEYWGHAASYLPMKDYRFSLPRKREYLKGRAHWFEQDKSIKRKVLRRIKREGPLQSKDFETPEDGRGNWYNWKPAKRALEQLFMEGRLMVTQRQGFQKVYDLTENVLPSGVITAMPSKSLFAEHLVQAAVTAHGILTEKEMYYQRGALDQYIKRAVKKLLKEGVLVELKLEGHEQTKFYGLSSIEPESDDQSIVQSVHILSPFDNLLIQRRRLQRLFDFDYTIECYLPEHKRIYGYFTLPLLYGDRFIARLDPKADRKDRVFYVRNLVFEDDLIADYAMMNALGKQLRQFATFNGCDTIVLEKCNQKKLRQQLRIMIRQQSGLTN